MVEGQEGWYCWLLGGQTVVNMAADHLRLVSNTNEQELQLEAEETLTESRPPVRSSRTSCSSVMIILPYDTGRIFQTSTSYK